MDVLVHRALRTRAASTEAKIPHEVAHSMPMRDAGPEHGRMRRVAPSHILRLLPELLAEIFMLHPEMRLIFCQICRLWRQTGISTPRLWNTIQISMFDSHFESQM
jgi:hypothetical protein